MSLFRKSRQRGQGMTEYIIIVALIAIAAIGVFTFFGGTIRAQIAGMSQELAGQDGSQQIQKAQEHSQKAVDQANTDKGLGNYSEGNR